MSDFEALELAAYLSRRLDVPLSDDELSHVAARAVLKRAELEPLYAAGEDTPPDGVLTFTPR